MNQFAAAATQSSRQTERDLSKGVILAWADYSLRFDECSDIGEALTTYPLLSKTKPRLGTPDPEALRQPDKDGYLRPSAMKDYVAPLATKWIQCLAPGRQSPSIRLRVDAGSLTNQKAFEDLYKLQEAALSLGVRLGQTQGSSTRKISHLQFCSREALSLDFQLINAFPSAIEFINVDEEARQQLVVELSFDEVVIDSIEAEGASDSGVSSSFVFSADDERLSLFKQESDLRGYFSVGVKAVEDVKIRSRNEELLLDLYDLDFRYGCSDLEIRSFVSVETDRTAKRLQGIENLSESLSQGDRRRHQAHSFPGEVGLRHRSWGNFVEILSFKAILFGELLGIDSENSEGLQNRIESLFLPMIYARNAFANLGVSSRALPEVPTDEILKTHLLKEKESKALVLPLHSELKYPQQFFAASRGGVKSVLWDRGRHFHTPVRVLLPEGRSFCGTIHDWSVRYFDFDQNGEAQRAEIHLNILGIHELNAREESL
ncbi:MAG: hypothetical protein EA369_07460 [Bradymonadales bacterium]|nr:MAG: hypothetical protein EA369_07460 [Bradymonadales bacterium]